jgi:putative oxidoreductase
MKNIISFLGRTIFGLTFFVFGVFHLFNFHEMAEMVVPSYIPFPNVFVVLTGFALIAAAVSLIIKKHVALSMFLLSVFLILMIILVQLPNMQSPIPQLQQMALIGLLKDCGLTGAALYIAADNL